MRNQFLARVRGACFVFVIAFLTAVAARAQDTYFIDNSTTLAHSGDVAYTQFTLGSTTTLVLRLVSDYVVDAGIFTAANYTAFAAGQPTTGFAIFSSSFGTKSVTLSAGSYVVAVRSGATTSNKIRYELDYDLVLPGQQRLNSQGNSQYVSANGGRLWQPFTIASGNWVWIDGANIDLYFYLIPAAQLDNFKNGQTFSYYTDYEPIVNSNQPGGFHVNLPPGDYVLAFYNPASIAKAVTYTIEWWTGGATGGSGGTTTTSGGGATGGGGTTAIAPGITSQPQNQTLNVGATATFSVTASGTAPLSYQWRKNGTNISGATNASYSIPSVQTGDAGSYSVAISNSAGSIASNAATLTVNPPVSPLSISRQPSGQTTTKGGTASFSVTPTGGSGTYHYTWEIMFPAGVVSGPPDWSTFSDGNLLIASFAGTNSATLTLTNVANVVAQLTPAMLSGTQFRCLIGDGANSVLSSPVALIITDPAGNHVLLSDSFSLNGAAGRVSGATLDGKTVENSAIGTVAWSAKDLYQGGTDTFVGTSASSYIALNSGHNSSLAAVPVSLQSGKTYYLKAKVYPDSAGAMTNFADPAAGYISLGFYKRAGGAYIWDNTRLLDFVLFKNGYTLATEDSGFLEASLSTYPAYPSGFNWSSSSPAQVEVEWNTATNRVTAWVNGTVVLNAVSVSGTISSGDAHYVGFGRDFSMGTGSVVDDFEFGERTTSTSSNSASSRLTNLSIRSSAGTGSQTLIVGFSTNGTGSKRLLVRGIGPALSPLGVAGALPDPVLGLFSGSSQVDRNAGWGGGSTLSAAFASVGAFSLPVSSKDSALSSTLNIGGYTAQVTSASNSTGIALVELYDQDGLSSSARLSNVSARTVVGTGSSILIAGFSITGTGAKQVLIRAVGPTLASFGVSGTLADPRLAVYDGSNSLIQQNDDWGGGTSLSAAFSSVGAFALPSSSKDAAVIASLQPGSYTVQVSGVNNTTGVALVEVYELP